MDGSFFNPRETKYRFALDAFDWSDKSLMAWASSRLRPCCKTLWVQDAAALAAHNAVLHGPAQGLQRVAAGLVCVGEVQLLICGGGASSVTVNVTVLPLLALVRLEVTLPCSDFSTVTA